jgi:hypothetical protein
VASPSGAARHEESLAGRFKRYRDALDDVRALLFWTQKSFLGSEKQTNCSAQ